MKRYVRSLLLAGWRTCCVWHGDADQHQRLLESGFWGVLLAFCPCLDLLSSAPLERYVCSWLAGRGTLHHGHGNADKHQRVFQCCWQCVLAFLFSFEHSSSARLNAHCVLSDSCACALAGRTPVKFLVRANSRCETCLLDHLSLRANLVLW